MSDTELEGTVVLVSASLDVGDLREWTSASLAEFLEQERAEDLDWRRFQVVDGALVVSPQAMPLHERAVAKLILALTPVAPRGHDVIGSAGILVGRSYLVTDVTIVTESFLDSGRRHAEPTDVLLAVEVESPSSTTMDRIVKPAAYAAAGVRYYWRVETAPLRLTAYELRGGAYRQQGSWAASDRAPVREPFDLDLDVADLGRRGMQS